MTDTPEKAPQGGGATPPQAGPATPPAAPRAPRGMRIALVLSLALNLLLVGIIGGAALRYLRYGPPVPVADVGLGPFTGALAPEDRKALRDSFLRQTPGLRDSRREARDDLQRMIGLLRTDPWDPAAALSIMSRRTDRTVERIALGQSLFLERLGSMTADQRRALADRIEAMLERGRAGRDRDHAPGHD